MDSSLAKKNTTRFLLYSFVGLLVFSMGVFAMLGVYMSRKSTKTIHEVGEIYMSGMSEQMIADTLNISINTVKNQKTKAYASLRQELKDIGSFILLLGL